MNYQITTIGDCVKDIFILTPAKIISSSKVFGLGKKYLAFPYGEKIGIKKVDYDLGGSACNAAVTFSKLGIKTSFATIFGSDIYSREAIEILKKEKIGINFSYKEKGSSAGFSIILTGPDGDRSILAYRTQRDFNNLKIKKVFENSDAIYVAGINKYSKVLQKKILAYAISGKKILYINPSSYQINFDKKILRKIIAHSKAVCMNKNEALIFLGKRKMKKRNILKTIYKMGTEKVIITMGAKGSLYYDGENFYKIGIYKKKKKDSAGSGDAFFATFITARLKDENTENSLKLSAINAAHVASVFGAQKGLLRWNELKKKLKEGKVRVNKF